MRVPIGRGAAAVALLAVMLCGCSWTLTNRTAGDPRHEIVDTRACYYDLSRPKFKAQGVEKSAFAALPMALLGVLAEGIVDKGFDMMGLALRKAAGADAVANVTVKTGGYQYAARKNVAAFDPKAMTAKIAVAHGTFSNAGPTDNSATTQAEAGGKVKNVRVTDRMFKDDGDVSTSDAEMREPVDGSVAREKLGVTKETFLLVCAIEYSQEMTAMRLVPQYLLYDRGLAGKKKISLVAHFTFRLPSQPPAESADGTKGAAADNATTSVRGQADKDVTAFAATSLVFKDLEAKTVLTEKALMSKATEWMPMPEIAGQDKIAILPVVAEIQLVETKKPNKLLLLMAEAFESKKDDLKKEVNTTINVDNK